MVDVCSCSSSNFLQLSERVDEGGEVNDGEMDKIT
jgi:hypothetical protein